MYARLLVPIDGSATARLAIDEAAELAGLCGAAVVLVHVIEEVEHSNGFEQPSIYINEVRPLFLANGQKILDRAKGELATPGVAAETVLLEGKGDRVSELIALQATLSEADIIVLGTHGRRSVDRFLLGSDAEQVARIATVPVMRVRSRGRAMDVRTGNQAEAGNDA
ncbi:universal stress protein [Pseudomonas fluorescens]|uniref:Universal stress protein n=1 Tax=Pseudomonas fluorescens TaxID=294 RepID=A0A7Z6QLM6_PSEFL|nr:universal stress protein [Pseudomonas fluorescens]RDS87725.1 universal stress protein [Pseudomonas fluorescens]